MGYGIDSAGKVSGAAGKLATTNVPAWVAAKQGAAAAPISFCCCYLHGNYSDLTADDARTLSDAGLGIVSIWERGGPSKRSYFTDGQGHTDGADAWAWAAKIGQPQGTPVYFTADFNAAAQADWDAVNAYLGGVRRALDEYHQQLADQGLRGPDDADAYAIGIYGPSCLLAYCRDNGLATYFWQLNSTSFCNGDNKQPWDGRNMHQLTSGGDAMGEWFCGVKVDFDLADDNEGSWKLT